MHGGRTRRGLRGLITLHRGPRRATPGATPYAAYAGVGALAVVAIAGAIGLRPLASHPWLGESVKRVQAAGQQAVPVTAAWIGAHPDAAETLLRWGLPRIEEGPDPTPELGWRVLARSWVMRATGIDFDRPVSILQSVLPAAPYGQAAAPPASPKPDVVVIPGAPAPQPGPAPQTEQPSTPVQVTPPVGAAATPQSAGRDDTPAPEGGSRREVAQVPLPRPTPQQSPQRAAAGWGTAPIVGIVHTHTAESYSTPAFHPANPDDYFVWNSDQSGVVLVGNELAARLGAQYGIPALHNTTVHDFPSRARAYTNSVTTESQMLSANPSLKMLFDIHRDGTPNLNMERTVAGEKVAAVRIVVAASDDLQPHWSENLAFAEQLAAVAAEVAPGLITDILVAHGHRYNENLSPHLLLLEVGNYNTPQADAIRSADLLADVIATYLNRVRAGTPLPAFSPAKTGSAHLT
ncbi:MAG TPA: stage II sporulation protein P, partial [Limnochordia bacterium]|nr:stage II sporulation protein P [Limnochordia bacterium]